MSESQTLTGLLLTLLPGLCSIWCYFHLKQTRIALWLLFLSALSLRLWMAALDPYLQNWDERFHALVAKSMMVDPLRPTLFADPVLPYKVEDWWQNHIWVHKQPLFLWLMALAMKIWGSSPFVLRLPSVILGTFMLAAVYKIAKRWTRNEDVAFVSLLLATCSWYALEMISGWISLDHNDFTFTCFITFALWAFIRWIDTTDKWKWAFWIGVFVGCAVLIKWLTAFIVFGVWGLFIVLSPSLRKGLSAYLQVTLAFGVCLLTFLPWQFYISSAFPAEAAASYAYNFQHIVKNLGHEGPWYFHLKFFPSAYHWLCIPFFGWGLYKILISKKEERALSVSFYAMVVVLYAFFAVVATKMPAFVFPAQAVIWITIGYGLWDVIQRLSLKKYSPAVSVAILIVISVVCLKPGEIVAHRAKRNVAREYKLLNTHFYKNLSPDITNNYVIFNTPLHENIELMFYKGGTSYSVIPTLAQVDSLVEAGFRIAYFSQRDSTNILPEYLTANKQFLPVYAPVRQ